MKIAILICSILSNIPSYVQQQPHKLEKKIAETVNDCYGSEIQDLENDYFLGDIDFTKTYFWHLTNNMPLNVGGICGYTAMSMLLSFYDTFLVRLLY